jgi:hypothetical protein
MYVMRIGTPLLLLLGAFLNLGPRSIVAQSLATDDPVVLRIWQEGMENTRTQDLAQALMDSIGPRLAGTPGFDAAGDWLLDTYGSWGVSARREEYGTWRGWRQGILHVDLLAPRVQSLEAELLAYSPGNGEPVVGEVVMPPEEMTEEDVEEWLGAVEGKYVLTTAPEPMCRAPQELERWARPATVERIDSLRAAAHGDWSRRMRELGGSWRQRELALDEAGVAGILTSRWSGGWGVNKVFDTGTERAPGIDLSCEDYGMLARMVERDQAPRIRVHAEAEDRGEVPQFNIIAELTGTELPDEYVVLSAHLDSWHAGTGATDNGTGTITMLEAMRILKAAYPEPRRTILAGHWGAEEMGLIGSRSFVEDHPEVIEGLQAAFNQDNGTWRIERIEGQGFLRAGEHLARWMSLVPSEIGDHVRLELPGAQDNRGSDHSALVCAEVPAFRLQSSYEEYRQYTWHTNRDTYDKIVFDDLKENATLAALLAYAASEDPERVPRDRAALFDPLTGHPRDWMSCDVARRSPN